MSYLLQVITFYKYVNPPQKGGYDVNAVRFNNTINKEQLNKPLLLRQPVTFEYFLILLL